MGEGWRPLDVGEGWRDEGALHKGVPGWLRASITKWVESELNVHGRNGWDVSEDGLRELERAIRTPLDWDPQGGKYSALRSLQDMATALPDRYLVAVDYLLHSHHEGDSRTTELATILEESGSAWGVVIRDGIPTLEQRVEATVAAAAEEVMLQGGRAGEHLRRAWHSAYGLSPSPSTAYREAVRAVEAAGAPMLEPNNEKATLGTMIGALRSSRDRWTVVLRPSDVDPVEVLLGMMGVLWKGQLDRHGTPDEDVPIEVSTREADAAGHLATTLVHWLSSGALTPST